ncbi:glycoside hydrolase family 79 protein [Aplosporella prunicola CBS 121167]|uniref:Glycoside hydrolase family 79 protein n=1 Tax=Aplosporella prunicola CBS 121167 TaxID=1176127 RepID=A0A6A6B6P7_9PEZI|nr:glycoside hydrolase family 79 protein [Aplosporella prunicola CBS 121167]KAF2139789.1 glycoside hydrolase family 79 protein [Aplosporella prunicola CBS 121167]
MYSVLFLAPLAAHAIEISIPTNLSSRALLHDAYGYSIEPVWVDDYLKSDLATNLLSAIADITGKPPPIRVGGNTADQTYLRPDQNQTSIAYPTPSTATTFNITPAWYDTWASYFPEGTDLLYTLNLRDNTSAWANAVAEAEAVHEALGDKLKLLELGNEIDHFVNKGWRAPGWDVAQYIDQWHNLTGQVIASEWYQKAANPPKFQAAVFADPPWVPDQHDDTDDFDVVNLTAAGLVDSDIIDAYAMHLYPQSTCDTERWYRMRLDLLSNHTTLWLNVSQYVPQVAAADAAGIPFVLGETNSISCSGRSGISDTFGAALWGVDYVLMAASIGIEKVYFHLGAQSEYSSFTPIPYTYKGENLTAGIRAGFYGHYFLAKAIAGDLDYSIAALPGVNSSDLSGYGIFGEAGLQKLVFLDMGVWNSSSGLHNPSTLTATDSTFRSNGTRPSSGLRVHTPWEEGAEVKVTRLSAPGTNAKSSVDVSGVSFDSAGAKVGEEKLERVEVGAEGVLAFELQRAQAVLLEVAKS